MFKIKYHSTTKISYAEAAILAKEEANVVRHGGSEAVETKSELKDYVQHREYASSDS
jgi:anthranilate phosphoribosyltransferase